MAGGCYAAFGVYTFLSRAWLGTLSLLLDKHTTQKPDLLSRVLLLRSNGEDRDPAGPGGLLGLSQGSIGSRVSSGCCFHG